MSVRLLDVNALIALMWPAHDAHSAVQEWFAKISPRGWATCPFTQAAFVRIVSNPAFSPDAVTPVEALNILNSNLQMKGHHFWKDHIGYAEAVEPFRERLVGHRQVTDAYLLGLALRNKGRLATLDRAIVALLNKEDEGHSVEIISG